MKLYAFDVDDTLEISNGPVRLVDLQALRNYTERYEYDPVGNFAALAHRFNGAG